MKNKKDKKYWYVYLTTNLITNEKYIGEHGSNKKFDESYIGSGKIIKQKIKQYGRSNFKCEVLEYCNSEQDVLNREEYYINEYNAVDDASFYNINPRSSVIGPAGRKIMSDKAKLRSHPATTKGYVWINDKDGNHYIKKSDLNKYSNYTFSRKNFSGFGYGEENNHNKRTKLKIENIINDNLFYDYFIQNGKSKTEEYYKISDSSFYKICEALNISKELQEEVHKKIKKQGYLNRRKKTPLISGKSYESD